MTHPNRTVEQVIALHAAGKSFSEISRLSGVSRPAIRDWLGGRQPRRDRPGCFTCDERAEISTGDYAYLLGLYLGDGCLSLHPRGVWRLRIVQDARYVGLIDLCRETIAAVSQSRVGLVPAPGCVVISSYSKHWIHLFPQHGAGRKHERSIQLEPWQARIVGFCPEQFLRGLIHSDGCRSLNTIKHTRLAGDRDYSYQRYFFKNASAEIRRMFTDSCDALAIHWTQTNARTVAISRKSDVAFLDSFIGPKY